MTCTPRGKAWLAAAETYVTETISSRIIQQAKAIGRPYPPTDDAWAIAIGDQMSATFRIGNNQVQDMLKALATEGYFPSSIVSEFGECGIILLGHMLESGNASDLPAVH